MSLKTPFSSINFIRFAYNAMTAPVLLLSARMIWSDYGELWNMRNPGFPADNDRGTETEAITDSSEFILFDSKNITFLYHYSYDDCVEIMSVPYSLSGNRLIGKISAGLMMVAPEYYSAG